MGKTGPTGQLTTAGRKCLSIRRGFGVREPRTPTKHEEWKRNITWQLASRFHAIRRRLRSPRALNAPDLNDHCVSSRGGHHRRDIIVDHRMIHHMGRELFFFISFFIEVTHDRILSPLFRDEIVSLVSGSPLSYGLCGEYLMKFLLFSAVIDVVLRSCSFFEGYSYFC